MASVIGAGLTQNRDHAAPVTNPHGFSIEWMRLAPGAQVSPFTLDDKMVLILREGRMRLVLNDDGDVSVDLGPWDTFSIPAGVVRRIEALGDTVAEALVVVSGDHRKRPRFAPAVVAAARKGGWALDAGGFVAPAEVLPHFAMAGE